MLQGISRNVPKWPLLFFLKRCTFAMCLMLEFVAITYGSQRERDSNYILDISPSEFSGEDEERFPICHVCEIA